MEKEQNSNIQVEITDATKFHCFRLVLNPRSQGPDLDRRLDEYHRAFISYQMKRGASLEEAERRWNTRGHARDLQEALEESGIPAEPIPTIEIMLHARALVDLIHQCSTALCEWQKQATEDLLVSMTGLTREELKARGIIG